MAESPHYKELLQLLHVHQVEYLIVGGTILTPTSRLLAAVGILSILSRFARKSERGFRPKRVRSQWSAVRCQDNN